MKKTIFVLLALLCASAHADGELKAGFNDNAWDGSKVPAGQQCARFGGKGATPAIRVEQIPTGANALVMEFSDQTYQPMNDGGHGKIGYRIASGTRQSNIPSVPGHTFDLPAGFFLVEAQRAPAWDKAGAYLPPCSGGKGNSYLVTVKAVKEVNGKAGATLAETTLKMGQY
jgi:hypothetical protein